MIGCKLTVLILAYFFASASTLQTENGFDEVPDGGIVDDTQSSHHDFNNDAEIDHSDHAFETAFIESESAMESHFYSAPPTADSVEEHLETDPKLTLLEVEDIHTVLSDETRSREEVESSIITNDEPVLIVDASKNPIRETVFESEDDSTLEDVLEARGVVSSEEDVHLSSALTKAAEIIELKSKIESLQEKNEQLEENLDYYHKHESFLYKLIGGQMIEFVCIAIGLFLLIKISDILLMVTDILEKVVIPIVRVGPVYSMQSKEEVSIMF